MLVASVARLRVATAGGVCQKQLAASDKISIESTMRNVPSRIVAYAKSQPEGALFGANELLGFGARAAVDQALVRLVNAGDIMRVARGTYTLPVATRFGLRGPDELLLARSFARREGVTIARHGADEAHRLGLSTQVPVKTVWLTSGRAALLSVGSQTVAFKPAAQWLLADPGGRAGALLRAVAWLGADEAVEQLRALGPSLSAAERETLLDARGQMPGWMAKAVSDSLSHG